MLAADAILQNRYRVVSLLSQGGMGAVYQAIDHRLDITVALKECCFNDEVLRRQFEREARLLAKLRHPAITKVIDHFTEGEGQFLVMEFIPGDDLLGMLKVRGKPFPPGEVLQWGDQLLDALDYLHGQDPQIIHRDIKPQNLKLINSGQIILLDFGLAKSCATQMSRVTSSGSIFGYTQHYAPMEQIQGAGTDPRADLYALAATFYQLTTGVIPVDALSRATAVLNHQPDPLRPACEINNQLTPEVAAVLMQAMALNRDERPASAERMRQALHAAMQSPANRTAHPTASAWGVNPAVTGLPPQEQTAWLSSPPVAPQPAPAQAAHHQATRPATAATLPAPGRQPPRQSSRRLWVVGSLVGVIALIAVFVLVIFSTNRHSPPSSTRPDQSNPATQHLPSESATTNTGGLRQTMTGHNQDVNSITFSPDGKMLASGSSDGTMKVWDVQIGEMKQTFEASGNEVVAVAFSPDGQSLAIAVVSRGGNGMVIIRDSQTAEVKQKLAENNIQAIAFSPDGKTLAIANISSSLNLWDVASGKVKQTLEGQDIQTHSVAFSPDGRTVAGGGYGNTVKLWEAETGALKQTLAGHDNEILAVVFSPDGKTLASGSEDGTVKLWDAQTGSLKQTLHGLDCSIPAISFSPDSKTLASACNHTIMLWDAQSAALKQTLTGHDGFVHAVVFSPDGKTLASGGADASVKVWSVSGLK